MTTSNNPSTLWMKSSALVGVAVVTGVLVTFIALQNKTPGSSRGIPIPFLTRGSTLAGSVTADGKRNNLDLFQVNFDHGETHEHLLPDRVYLVHVPASVTISAVPLDPSMSLSDGSHSVDYFGYRYSDSSATQEILHASGATFATRFPAQFFASQKARLSDGVHGNALAHFETLNAVTFRPTDGSDTSGKIRIDPVGALYVLIVNEASGADLTVRGIQLCGNGIMESPEQCDDGNSVETDACTTQCKIRLPIPFESGSMIRSSVSSSSSSGASCDPMACIDCGMAGGTCQQAQNGCNVCVIPVSVCGNGILNQGETCDDANTTAADGCSSACSIESNFSCSGAPSVCQSYTDVVKALADTNHNGTVSDNEALSLTLTVIDAPDKPFADVHQYDINGDGVIDSVDISIILNELDTLAPTNP